jgi:hypothetical protein
MLVSCAINVNFQNSLVTEKYTKTEDYELIESMKQKRYKKNRIEDRAKLSDYLNGRKKKTEKQN